MPVGLNWRVWIGALVVFAGSGVSLFGVNSETALTADQVVERAVARAEETQSRAGQPGYTYTKLTVTEELDADGRVKERKERVYRVFFDRGATYVKLLTVNGKPPGEAELKKQAENETNARQILGSSKRAKRENRENFLRPEVVARFKFTLLNQESINGRPAYEVAFEPKCPESPARHMIDRLLNRISGTLWIDAEEFEIARADISLGSEVDFFGGVVGSLKKLAYSMTRTRVGEGIWFNTLSTGDFEGRKLLDSMRIKTKSQSTNFRPLRLTS